MAATITATLKSATANSYVTLAEANTYFETVPDSATWENKTDDQKNRALISACSEIDNLPFLGVRCDTDQALKWPRNNYAVDGVSLECSSIPLAVKKAQYLLARELANDPTVITGTKGTDGLYEQVEMGDMKIKYNKDSQAMGAVNNLMEVFPWLQPLLGAYTLGGVGGYQVRVVRG